MPRCNLPSWQKIIIFCKFAHVFPWAEISSVVAIREPAGPNEEFWNHTSTTPVLLLRNCPKVLTYICLVSKRVYSIRWKWMTANTAHYFSHASWSVASIILRSHPVSCFSHKDPLFKQKKNSGKAENMVHYQEKYQRCGDELSIAWELINAVKKKRLNSEPRSSWTKPHWCFF